MKLLWILMLMSGLAFAEGQGGGNGGGAHVCGDKVELYDFYEGRHPLLNKLPVWQVDSRLTVEDYLKKAMDHIKQDLGIAAIPIEEALKEFLKTPYDERVLPFSIPRIYDADIALVDQGCDYLQVANWNSRFNRIFFSKTLFERMDSMNQAGLYLHEVLYKLARDNVKTKNSDHIRRLVALVFSNVKLTTQNFLDFFQLPEAVAAIPRTGSCVLSVEAHTLGIEEGPYMNLSLVEAIFHLVGDKKRVASLPSPAGLFKGPKRRDLTVACEDIFKVGLHGVVWVENFVFNSGEIRFTFRVNGRKVTKDLVQQLNSKAPQSVMFFTLKPEDFLSAE